MKSFWLKLLAFSFPLLLFITPPCYILFISGENFHDIDDEIVSGNKYLIGYAYNEDNYRYVKWKGITSLSYNKVVALGSSRVLQFRSNMFDSSFYNAGYAIKSINDFMPFLEAIRVEMYPEYLIIGLDQWMFNKNWDNLKSMQNPEYWKNGLKRNPDATILKKIWEDFSTNKLGAKLPTYNDSITRIGLNAFVNNKGFRNDGSMQYDDQIVKLMNNDPQANDYQFSDTYNRILHGNNRFEYASEMNIKAEIVLDEFLSFCKSKKIKVIAFLPPFADKVYHQMLSSGRFDYVSQIYPNLKPIFKKHDYELYDFSSITSVGSNDGETLDGFHGSELTYLKLVISMLESGSILNEVTDLERLRFESLHPMNRYTVYKY